MGELYTMYEDSVISLEVLDIAGDNETINGTGVDMLGYDGVCFIAAASQGEVGAFSLKAQSGTDAAFGDAADLAGSAVAFATAVDADGKTQLDLKNPKERYIRPALVIPNLTTPCAVCVIAIRYNAAKKATSNMTGELHVNPVEGTA